MNFADNIDKLSLSYLEHEFSLDFTTPLFVNLAQKYIDTREYKRAMTVCNIGLNNNPENTLAKFILSKAYFCQGNLEKAEILLTDILSTSPHSTNPLKLLIEVKKQLGRTKKEVDGCVAQLENLYLNDQNSKKISSKKKASKDNVKVLHKHKNNLSQDVKIDNNMATFAFYNIAKSQKKYQFAFNILLAIEKKSGRSPKIIEEEKILTTLINNQ